MYREAIKNKLILIVIILLEIGILVWYIHTILDNSALMVQILLTKNDLDFNSRLDWFTTNFSLEHLYTIK